MQISYIGMQAQEVAIKPHLKITLKPDEMCIRDRYGDIPYNEAGKGDVSGLEFPHYQEQQEVYRLSLIHI